MLKTRRFGYDGKGQAIIREGDDPDRIWEELGTKSAILEAFIPFEREISVIAARCADGEVECFDVTENEHSDHILKTSRAPAAISDALAAQARGIAEKIATALDYVGVLAVEMFVVQGDGGPKILVNEIAPRVHNSGHWTLDGASISQFEQHIRAIAGWPLGKPVRHGPVTMTNLIGDEINDYEQWLTVPGATVHLYGKGAAAAGPENGPCDGGRSPADERPPERDRTRTAWSRAAAIAARRWTLPALSDTSARSRLRAGLSPALCFTRIPIRSTERGCRVQVLVRDNNVDQALKALKKKMQREGIFREMKLRGHYEKPSEKKAREKAEAVRRARKLARKKLQREGLLPMKPKPVFGAGPGAERGGPGGGRGGPGGGPRGPR